MQTAARRLLWMGGAAAAAVIGSKLVLRHLRWFEFSGKSVLVTGGSRGLGLVLARHLIDRGARVAIAARTEEDLTDAAAELRSRGGEVFTVAGDISDPTQAERIVRESAAQLGGLDVLINCAGIIEVGPLESMTFEDFEKCMAINCWGILHTSRAAAPIMRERGWGRILNVASIGGQRAVPHLLPYSTSKFAAVGLSLGLRAELAKDNIVVTVVCPSLMRTGSPRNATFKGQHEKEFTWFNLGDALPIVSMDADTAARQILAACQSGAPEVLVNNPLNVAVWAQSFAPNLTAELLTAANYLLPRMGGIGTGEARGYESETPVTRSFLTALDREAAAENNQRRPRPAGQE